MNCSSVVVTGTCIVLDHSWGGYFHCNVFLLSAGNSHAHMNEDRQRRSDFCSRMVSEPNVFLDSFSYPDTSQASDTVSVDSSDSLETSFSACSPDNISRLEMNLMCRGKGLDGVNMRGSDEEEWYLERN